MASKAMRPAAGKEGGAICDGMHVGLFAVGCALSLSCFAAEIAVPGGSGMKIVHGFVDRLVANGLYGFGIGAYRCLRVGD